MNMAERRMSRLPSEKIEVKPSVELIPDEFEHHTEDGSDIVIHVFTDETEEDFNNAQQFFDALKSIGYSDLNRHSHNLERNDYDTVIKYIQDEANNSNANGLILFFSCSTNDDGKIFIRRDNNDTLINIQEIWKDFTYNYCKGLKNKPKIFIFEIRMMLDHAEDSCQLRAPTYALTYDTPAEADILIIYNKTTDETHGKFVNKLGKFMRKYGQREDIITLVSCIPSNIFRPMIISTLTRKFYFTPSEYRGHHYNLHELEQELTSVLQQIKDTVGAVQERPKERKKVKKKFSLLFRSNHYSSEKEKEPDTRHSTMVENRRTIASDPSDYDRFKYRTLNFPTNSPTY